MRESNRAKRGRKLYIVGNVTVLPRWDGYHPRMVMKSLCNTYRVVGKNIPHRYNPDRNISQISKLKIWEIKSPPQAGNLGVFKGKNDDFVKNLLSEISNLVK